MEEFTELAISRYIIVIDVSGMSADSVQFIDMIKEAKTSLLTIDLLNDKWRSAIECSAYDCDGLSNKGGWRYIWARSNNHQVNA